MALFVVLPRDDGYWLFRAAVIEGSLSSDGNHVIVEKPDEYRSERIPREYTKEIPSAAGPARLLNGTFEEMADETYLIISRFPLTFSR